MIAVGKLKPPTRYDVIADNWVPGNFIELLTELLSVEFKRNGDGFMEAMMFGGVCIEVQPLDQAQVSAWRLNIYEDDTDPLNRHLHYYFPEGVDGFLQEMLVREGFVVNGVWKPSSGVDT